MDDHFILTDWYYSADNPRNDDNGDDRSDARYDDEGGEPTTSEVKDTSYACYVDESGGERERRYGDGI